MKKFGDVVVLQSGKDVVNALVVCSIDRDGEEHLTLVYLHPSKDVGSFSGTQLDAAISKAFDVAPWKEGAQSGWRLSWGTETEVAQESLSSNFDYVRDLELRIAELTAERDAALVSGLASDDAIELPLKISRQALTPEQYKVLEELSVAYDAAISKSKNSGTWIDDLGVIAFAARYSVWPRVSVDGTFDGKHDAFFSFDGKYFVVTSPVNASDAQAFDDSLAKVFGFVNEYRAQLSGSGGLAGEAESRIAKMFTVKLPPELATLPGIAGIGSQYAEPDMVIPPNPPSAELPAGDAVATETKQYQDGSSATGPAPLPDHSPDGSPEVTAEKSQATPEG